MNGLPQRSLVSFPVHCPPKKSGRAMWLFALVCSLLFAFPMLSPAATPKSVPPVKAQVIILPFEVNIPGAYGYLRQGLASTLAGRLSVRANISAVAQGAASEQMAQALKTGDNTAFARRLEQSGAEYLIIGSLAPRGGQFELTGYVFSQTPNQAPKKFQQLFNTVDDAMGAVDELAWDISGKVFGKKKPEAATGTAGTTGTAAFQTAHPERAYLEGLFSGLGAGLESGGQFELVSSNRSKQLPMELMDLNVADLDGDGKDEVVLLGRTALMIHHFDDGQFRMLATLDLPSHLRYHWISFADLDQNGLQEIYLSASNDRDQPDSSVLEWNGTKITTLSDHAGWYLQTVTTPGQPPLLLGQAALSQDFGGGAIFQMRFSSKKELAEEKRLELPQGANLPGLTVADITGDGRPETLLINNRNRLQVYSLGGALLWTSAETFGATDHFFGTLTSPNNAADSEESTRYIPTRIVVADLDSDGTSDVLVCNNRLETVPFMANLRYFDGGSLVAMKWQNSGLTRLWETRKLTNTLVNYQVSPVRGRSGEYSIYFAEMETSYPFVFWSSPSTYLDMYTVRVNGAAR